MARIGILGAGTWGAALSRLLYGNGHSVTVWSAIGAEAKALRETHRHPKLPGAVLPEGVVFTADIAEAARGADLIVFATPSVYIRSTAERVRPYLPAGATLVSVAKGIEPDTFLSMTGVIADALGIPEKGLVALSGPTHAEEVVMDLPTAIVAASGDPDAAKRVQLAFSNSFFRTYTNPDQKGVELCGAMKNIIALAAGVSDGIGYGDNAKAGLITRGIAEIARLGKAMGCPPETFAGLAGVGDLIVTATSRHSRNNRAGFLLGQGCSAKEATERVGMVVEGLNALPAAIGLSQKYGVELPITFGVDAIVHGADPKDVVNKLMTRAFRNE